MIKFFISLLAIIGLLNASYAKSCAEDILAINTQIAQAKDKYIITQGCPLNNYKLGIRKIIPTNAADNELPINPPNTSPTSLGNGYYPTPEPDSTCTARCAYGTSNHGAYYTKCIWNLGDYNSLMCE